MPKKPIKISRMDAITRTVHPAEQMLRIRLTPTPSIDYSGRLLGRGAYVYPDPKAISSPKGKAALARLGIKDELYEEVLLWASTRCKA